MTKLGGRAPFISGALGEFVLRERLGEGGFATVWRADQPALGRDAVIKVLHASGDGGQAERFLAEVKLAASLDHPYAAHVYAFGAEPDGRLWIAMERVRGTPLDELLLVGGPLPLERLVPLVDRLCEVVQTAHEQGIVHRDLKPANVMVLSRAGRLLPKLLDLGVAIPAGAAGEEGARAGTPRYMAPEAWSRPATVDGRADIYALGVLVYECLTGRAPFEGPSWYALARAHARQPVPPLGPGFPPALDAVLARAMAKRAADRYASAGELGAALRSAAGVSEARAALPQLPAGVRDGWMGAAPQPLAEAVAALDAAGNAHQAVAAARALISATSRWLALVAMAAASRAGGQAPERARELRRRAFTDEEWLALAREQTAAHHERPETFPLPDLARPLPAPPDLDVRAPTEEELRVTLAERLPGLADWLGALDFVLAYPLARARRGVLEKWSGLRRAPRATLATTTLPDGEAALLDAEGVPVCVLGPLVQIAAPAPGAAEEVFLLEGPGRHGARLVAIPGGFERQDDAPWEFLRARLAGDDREGRQEDAERPPWPGLAPFTVADAARYVGREREAQAVANRLRVTPLLAVVGPSGAGKSSFVQAGVLPILPAGWRTAVTRPGSDPEAAIARALAGGPDLLVVDQLEELFTLCADREARERVGATLAAAERVIVTLRDDFLMRAEALPSLREPLARGLVLLSTPAEADLRRILVEPARRAGYDFDDPLLPAEMARAVADHPGALALLSFTAARLWDGRDRHFRRLLRRVYDETGGVGGALAAHAEETLASLRPDEQRLVREAFRRLVTPEGTRAVVNRADLEHVLGAGAGRVLERLVGARLLVVAEGEQGQERVEVVHEALLDAWPRLVAWRREDATGARLRAQLGNAARQWEERGRAPGLLWRDEALADLARLRRDGGEGLTPVEDAFASASLAEAARGRRRRRALVGLAFAALTAGVLVLLQMNRATDEQRRQAQDRLAELHEEQGRQALLAGQPDHALVYLAEAERLGRRRDATRYLVASALRVLSARVATLEGHTGVVWHVAHASDGSRLVSASEDGTARVWDVAGVRPHVTLRHEAPVWRSTFSPDGTLVATASFDGTARLWRSDGTPLHTFRHEQRVYSAVFSPDGTRLATSSRDGQVILWSVATGAELARLPGHGAIVRAVAFRPDGTELATVADDGTLRVAGLDGRVRLTIPAHTPRSSLWWVSFSPDGERLATAGADRSAAVWDARDGAPVARLRHNAQVFSASFDASGTQVLTASADASANVWQLQPDGGVALVASLAHPALVFAATWSADGGRLATAAGDGSVRVYTAAGVPIARLSGHAGEVRAVIFAPAGDRVVAGDGSGAVTLWRAQPPVVLRDLDARDHRPWSARWSPDGARVYTTGLDQTVRAWDAAAGLETGRFTSSKPSLRLAVSPDGQRLARDVEQLVEITGTDGTPVRTLAGHTAQVESLDFSSDGRLLATAAADGVRVWSTADGSTLLSLAPPAAVCATFAPGGGTVAACGVDGNVRLHALPSGAPEGTLDSGRALLSVLAFDARGERILCAGQDRTASILSVPEGRLLATLEGHTAQILSASWAGELAVTSSQDGSVRIWDGGTGKLLDVFEQHGGRVTSVQPHSDRLVSSSYDSSAKIWSIALDDKMPLDLERLVRCRIPFRLEKGQPLPFSGDLKGCKDTL